jgi:hypothetical protein
MRHFSYKILASPELISARRIKEARGLVDFQERRAIHMRLSHRRKSDKGVLKGEVGDIRGRTVIRR